MTSFLTIGSYALSDGVRMLNPATNKEGLHVLYHTAVRLAAPDSDLDATLRVYTPASEKIHPDGTVISLLAKVLAPAEHNELIEMESITLQVFPGDPKKAGYQSIIPDAPPHFIATGNVPAASAPLPAEYQNFKTFFLNTGEYVGGGPRLFPILCVFPNTRRWATISVPQASSCVEVVGICAGREGGGKIQLNIENITLNIGPHTLPALGTTPSTTTGSSVVTTPQHSLKFRSKATPGSTQLAMLPISTLSAPTVMPETPTPSRGYVSQAVIVSEPKHIDSTKRKAPVASSSKVLLEDDDEIEEEEAEEEEEEPPTMGKGKRRKTATQQRELRIQAQSEHIHHGGESERREIVAVTNKIWDENVEYGMVRIPSIIAPGSEIFLTHPFTAAIRRVKKTPAVLAWLRAKDILYSGDELLDLAWLLTRFQEHYIQRSNAKPFRLRDISYVIGPDSATYGLALYDTGLAKAYKLSKATYISPTHRIPVSTGPFDTINTNSHPSDAVVAELLTRALRLANL
ncbi:hypothetical protein HMN09_01121300 [Mycena chlorophos]|uniref:Uncharacterized protein n=1 Tax=Mycena chlorophos TaxID=658473 RepID=A0A8H6SBN1_MYCCL|nr:hypothetical protein HMN09_01121300 [Mycena chlorophos]